MVFLLPIEVKKWVWGVGAVEDFQIFFIVALQHQLPLKEVQPNRSLSTSVAWIIPILIRTLQFRIASERYRQTETDRESIWVPNLVEI